VTNWEETIKMPINEPAAGMRKSQIQVSRNNYVHTYIPTYVKLHLVVCVHTHAFMCAVCIHTFVRTCVNLCTNKLWLDKVHAGRYLFAMPVPVITIIFLISIQ